VNILRRTKQSPDKARAVVYDKKAIEKAAKASIKDQKAVAKKATKLRVQTAR